MRLDATRGAFPCRLAVLAFLLSNPSAVAQTQSSALPALGDTQVWTDFVVEHLIRDKTKFFLDGGLRWGRDVSSLVYERIGGGISVQPWKYLTLAPRYSFVSTEPTSAEVDREHRLGMEATFAATFRRWTVADRNVIERRFRLPRDSTRYRTRLRVERAF